MEIELLLHRKVINSCLQFLFNTVHYILYCNAKLNSNLTKTSFSLFTQVLASTFGMVTSIAKGISYSLTLKAGLRPFSVPDHICYASFELVSSLDSVNFTKGGWTTYLAQNKKVMGLWVEQISLKKVGGSHKNIQNKLKLKKKRERGGRERNFIEDTD